uniref:Serpentine receptor class gamma n=1 Tax=Panagrolaimus davidi TaxID=227884 RepID=A0A914PAJ1_9BILA
MFSFYFYDVYFSEISEEQKRKNEHTVSIIQVYFTTVSIPVIIAIVIFCSKRKITTFSDKFATVEKRLIYQSIAVLILVEADCLIWKINNVISVEIPEILWEIGDYIIPIYQLIDIIILFILSESFRASVLKFVTVGHYGPKVVMITSVTNSGSLTSQKRSQRSWQR